MDKVDFRAVSGKDFSRIIVAVIDGETCISGTDAAKATGHVWTDFAVERFVKDGDKRTADIPDSQIVINRNGITIFNNAECDAEEKLYSAKEIGNMFGLLRQKEEKQTDMLRDFLLL